MTAGTRRNGSSKFGLGDGAALRRLVGAGRQALERQDRDGQDAAEYGADGYAVFTDEAAEFAVGGLGEGDDPGDVLGGAPGRGDGPGQEAGRRTSAGRYAGRHASSRGKATRKRVGRVVPVAAVAATLAAGTAVYALAAGQPQAARLNTAMSSVPQAVSAGSGSGAGHANAAGSGTIKVAEAKASNPTRASATHSARPAATRKPSAAASHPAATASASAAAQATKPAATPSASTATAATTLSCNLSYSLLPDNVTAIVSFLLAHGYSDNAAAGIAGNIYQESKGNPESEGMGGGGLIGWTPLPTGYVTGNVTTDLQTQLSALLTFNNGWSQYLSALNSAATPADAAYIYVTDFERAGIPAASTRESSATNVASACGI